MTDRRKAVIGKISHIDTVWHTGNGGKMADFGHLDAVHMFMGERAPHSVVFAAVSVVPPLMAVESCVAKRRLKYDPDRFEVVEG